MLFESVVYPTILTPNVTNMSAYHGFPLRWFIYTTISTAMQLFTISVYGFTVHCLCRHNTLIKRSVVDSRHSPWCPGSLSLFYALPKSFSISNAAVSTRSCSVWLTATATIQLRRQVKTALWSPLDRLNSPSIYRHTSLQKPLEGSRMSDSILVKGRYVILRSSQCCR
jgi:hypothetical protein